MPAVPHKQPCSRTLADWAGSGPAVSRQWSRSSSRERDRDRERESERARVRAREPERERETERQRETDRERVNKSQAAGVICGPSCTIWVRGAQRDHIKLF